MTGTAGVGSRITGGWHLGGHAGFGREISRVRSVGAAGPGEGDGGGQPDDSDNQ